MNNWKGSEKHPWSNIWYYTNICMKVLTKAKKIVGVAGLQQPLPPDKMVVYPVDNDVQLQVTCRYKFHTILNYWWQVSITLLLLYSWKKSSLYTLVMGYVKQLILHTVWKGKILPLQGIKFGKFKLITRQFTNWPTFATYFNTNYEFTLGVNCCIVSLMAKTCAMKTKSATTTNTFPC